MLGQSKGVQRKPVKLFIYGPPGIGKSTIGALAPDPLFMDIEEGSMHLDVVRETGITSVALFESKLSEFKMGNHNFKSLIIDSADWMQDLYASEIVAENKWLSIEQPKYGAGWKPVQDRIGRTINNLLDDISKKYNIIIIAHAKKDTIKDPQLDDEYQQWSPKLNNKVSAMFTEWCTQVYFYNFKTYVVENDKGTKKGQGSKRFLFTTWSPAYFAKKRDLPTFTIPEEVQVNPSDGFVEFKQIMDNVWYTPPVQQQAPPAQQVQQQVTTQPEQAPEPQQQQEAKPVDIKFSSLQNLMDTHGVTEAEIRWAQSMGNKGQGYYPIDTPINLFKDDFVQGVLVAKWGSIYDIIQKGRAKGAINNITPARSEA